ncbi:hypothetical protein AJ87_13175 [Rhizobium yanglingense]|nr:hypothetical protein AJ87_13175 [Rhizobium yanglingense]
MRKLRRHPQLRDLIIDRLKAKWAPEQIAGRLLTEGSAPVSICPETIYRFIYGKEDYPLHLYEHLPERRRRRVGPASRVTASSRLSAESRNGLILLLIGLSSAIGKAIS